MSEKNTELAVNGGKPVCETPLSPEPWPPLYEETAGKLREIYFSGQWSFDSPAERDFQAEFAKYHDAKHGIFMTNGTVTLQAGLAVCGIGPGDEVIVPANTWMATAMAVHYTGAIPVFVDVEPSTLCLDPVKTEKALNKKTRAIIPVHLFGSMCNMDELTGLAESRGLSVIEDCAHMQGGKWKGRGVGSLGHVGSFSLQQSKTLTCGEGGICITNDDTLAERLFRYKHIGYAPGSMQGQAASGPPQGLICHNFRATAFQAAILDMQLKNLSERLDRYNRNASVIRSMIADCRGIRMQEPGLHATHQGFYGIVFILDEPPLDEIDSKFITQAAAAEGLPLGWGGYGPVYKSQLFNLDPSQYRIADGGCPVVEYAGTERAFTLSHQWLGADDETIEKTGEVICKLARCLQ